MAYKTLRNTFITPYIKSHSPDISSPEKSLKASGKTGSQITIKSIFPVTSLHFTQGFKSRLPSGPARSRRSFTQRLISGCPKVDPPRRSRLQQRWINNGCFALLLRTWPADWLDGWLAGWLGGWLCA
ncbi:hypothetical protein E2C01_071263 [Portunus trituberculatus]|uniref:Uncharacterized protein n=1 Tax=Portunus trituberculatus TaxID=210409 RepID=A0A5B7HWI9_PORTR|nr:hypothetical protein [Portunus trituberculatus]